VSLLEVAIAIGVIGIIAVAFGYALQTGLKGSHQANIRTSAKALANSNMDQVKATGYTFAPGGGVEDYANVMTTAPNLQVWTLDRNNGLVQNHIYGVPWDLSSNGPSSAVDPGIQKITIIIQSDNKQIFQLVDFKTYKGYWVHPVNSTLSRGFTLIEVVIAMAVGAVMLLAVGFFFANSMTTSNSGNNRMTAIRNADTAGYSFIRDLQSAPQPLLPSSMTLTAGSANMTLTLSIVSPADTTVAYSISSKNDLQRTEGGSTSTVAQHISSVAYTPGPPCTVVVTSKAGAITIVQSYATAPRVK
jgi:prepilin-type N-terminal cleavage/methylation domain-containing protein